MKTLIDNLFNVFTAGIASGRINAVSVSKGIQADPYKIAMSDFPYISVDGGGEKTVEIGADTAQKRIYTVVIECGVQVLDTSASLDAFLDLIDEMKAELELQANRQYLYDGHTWAYEINFFAWGQDENYFRGAQVKCEFHKVEERYLDY